MTTATDHGPWVRALRGSHDRLADIVAGLGSDGRRKQSYASEWSIAQVLSHLGSGAAIFLLNLDAGLTGGQPPEREAYQAIWDTWNARPPEEQAAGSIAANETLVSRVESITPEQAAAFSVPMFGMTMDLPGILRMRLSEHAVHTWDVAVAVDSAARVSPDAVGLLIDGLARMMPWMGKKASNPRLIAVTTASPERTFTLDTGGVTLTEGAPSEAPGALGASGALDLTAEALLRLVYGRVGEPDVASGEIRASNVSLADLQAVFPGF